MKKYVFEINSEEKIYLQIYNKISSDISNGLIKKNEHLPSKRNMAIDLLSIQLFIFQEKQNKKKIKN